MMEINNLEQPEAIEETKAKLRELQSKFFSLKQKPVLAATNAGQTLQTRAGKHANEGLNKGDF